MHLDSNILYRYPKIQKEDPYPVIPLYVDKDGLWYYYTIWHLELLTKI